MSATLALRALVLGAAAGGGLPQWNCGCGNCHDARSGALAPQTQSSLAVTVDGKSWALLNASPDLRQQIADNACLHPRALRASPIASVLVTNGDIDHIAGLLILREKQAFRLFATRPIMDIIEANSVFKVLDRQCVERIVVELDEPFALLDGLTATLFAVPGKVALFLEEGEPDLALEGEQTVGVEMLCEGRRAYYIPGCARISPALAGRIRAADLLFFDGTVYRDAEMAETGVGTKTGRRMGHMSIDGEEGSLAALAELGIARVVYTHINNTNPVWRDGPERRHVEARGFQIASDGAEYEA